MKKVENLNEVMIVLVCTWEYIVMAFVSFAGLTMLSNDIYVGTIVGVAFAAVAVMQATKQLKEMDQD